MLDSRARRHVDPFINALARGFLRAGITANRATVLALLVGLLAAGLVAAQRPWAGVVALWISGLLDAVDGAMARMTRNSAIGAIMDITFDRIVEISVIGALAWLHPEARLALLALCGAIAIAMSLFLSIAAAVRNSSTKSFYYAPGLGERTEAFLLLSAMAIDQSRLVAWTLAFIAVIAITVVQRARAASRLVLRDDAT